ncbi:ATP-binding protein [Chryseolinea lacunae]|uniref:histidine kinase n=1 Tax=Chryseolinea lacunae TaxID=2801331 RepID=A0ABS1KZW6_9BACT|nr:HAMP domain-containing sensor histidine kinase [Chryseolinea lacunae]MBL0744812.1 HAMP domain-containing histidine kinase [Chryseolinea lacunae]
MLWTIDTIGKRLFLAFSILALNVVIISALSYHYLARNKSIYDLTKKIENERTQIQRLLKLDLDFLRFETINQEFYRTSQSNILQERDSVFDLILQENILLSNTLAELSPEVHSLFDSINHVLKTYNGTFVAIKDKIIYRGFKDYGVEGRMRKFAHELEKHTEDISMVEVLSLRRHEKDYFLRKEKSYKRQFNHLADSLRVKLSESSGSSFVIHLLESYKENFNQLATLDEEIGLVPTQGLLGRLNALTNNISTKLTTISTLSDDHANRLIHESLISYIILGIASIIISLALTYVTASRLTRPIKKLSHSISKYMVTQGLNEDELKEPGVTNEMGNLSGAFIKMTRKLKAQFDEIQRKSQLLEKRNIELNRLNEELDRFIYSSAHDLKSPLSSMAGLVHLAEREMHVPEHSHYFEKMRSSIDKMEGFIRDITDYAKNKRQQIKPEKVSVQSILADIFQGLQFIPHAERIDKIVETSGGEFHTDKTRLEIILKNLLSNAVRYADLEKVRPFIRVEVTIQAEGAVVRIEDNGIGIADVHIYKIFEMFYRASDNAKGSGIGLFLVRESVKMLRGTIAVESVLNQGTTFTLSLPNLKQVNVNQLPESEPIKFLTAS